MDFLMPSFCTTVWSKAFVDIEDGCGDEKDQAISCHAHHRACLLLLFGVYSPYNK